MYTIDSYQGQFVLCLYSALMFPSSLSVRIIITGVETTGLFHMCIHVFLCAIALYSSVGTFRLFVYCSIRPLSIFVPKRKHFTLVARAFNASATLQRSLLQLSQSATVEQRRALTAGCRLHPNYPIGQGLTKHNGANSII